MSQGKKNQISIKKFFGWSTTSQVSSPKDDRNFDLNENLDILGHNEGCDEEFQGGEPSTQKKRKLKVRREFREQWKTKYKWLRDAKHEGKAVMKCIYCETHKETDPWGIGIGCSTFQHDSLVVHASSSIHKLSQAK